MTNNPFFIISAERANCTDVVNNARTSALEDDLKHSGYKFDQIAGCYKGSLETSFIVYTDSIVLALDLTARYQQDTVLVRTYDNKCSVLSKYGDAEFIGYFEQVTEAIALQQDNYSIIDGLYWIVINER